MQLSNDRQVNEKSFKIGMNSQNFARFDPLSWEKIEFLNTSRKNSPAHMATARSNYAGLLLCSLGRPSVPERKWTRRILR